MHSQSSQDHRLALVIGADGGIGGEIAQALNAHGWNIRAMTRRSDAGAASNDWRGPIAWVRGDAMLGDDVVAAAEGTSLIAHAANPPGYQNWRGLAVPMLANAIAAAKTSGARLMFPGNVYNYGPDAFPLLQETSPQHPLTQKGQVRVEMETMLRAATNDDVRSVIIRAGDFFGPHQPASWFKSLMISPGKPVTTVIYPGDRDSGHAWAYLPDLAETFARIADREGELPAFDSFHFGGHWIGHGVDFADAIRRAGGHPKAAIRSLPLWFHLATPFVGFLREAREMRYLWQSPVRLDNAKLTAFLGAEPHTPLDAALALTLRELGCLAPEAVAA